VNLQLPKRLKKVASFFGNHEHSAGGDSVSACRTERVVADIGCDHAYLSISLILSNLCDRAIASDLRIGPLEAAKKNIALYGCDDRITPVLANGLDGLEKMGITDVMICGMGGDTMIDILSRADFIKTPGMRLILQPQTAFAELVYYLTGEGFRIYAERYEVENKKPYRIIAAVFDGKVYVPSLKEALVGSLTFAEDSDAYHFFCKKIISTLEKKIKGAQHHGDDASELISICDDIQNSI